MLDLQCVIVKMLLGSELIQPALKASAHRDPRKWEEAGVRNQGKFSRDLHGG